MKAKPSKVLHMEVLLLLKISRKRIQKNVISWIDDEHSTSVSILSVC